MPDSEKRNIYETIKKSIKVCDSMLDVGCGTIEHELEDILNFDPSCFKLIYGIDRDPPSTYSCYQLYSEYKWRTMGSQEASRYLSSEFDEIFDKRYKIEKKDLRELTCKPESISLIICNYVLHFFPEEEKAQLIQRFYNFLQPSGILYLRMNTTTHPEILDPEKTTALGNHAYEPKPGVTPSDTYYLTDPETLLSKLPNYKILDEYSDRNIKNFTRVFVKE